MMSESDYPLEIEVQDVAALLQQAERFLLLDCREPDEFNLVRIAGSTHIPMRDIPARLGELEPFRGARIVVHCHHGGRSLRVTQWLRERGFEMTQNMAGGIDAWSLNVDATLPRY